MSNSAPIRTAVLGYGLGGRVFHCPFISAVPGLELAAIQTSRKDEASARYPHARILKSPEEAFADPAIDLVVVTTPNDTHVALATSALHAGKHIVVDKPIATSAAEARTLVDLAAAQKKILAPFHNRRLDNDFLTLRKLVEEKTLGRIVQVISNYDRFRPLPRPNTWKEEASPSTGILFDLGPHLLDQPLALFGAPDRISASVRHDRDDTKIIDAIDVILEYDPAAGEPGTGLRYECHATMLAADPSPRFRVHGTHGSYTKLGLDPQEAALMAGAMPPPLGSQQPWLPEPESAWGTLTLATQRAEPVQLTHSPYPSVTGDYRRFYASVRDAIRGEAPLAISAEDGYRTIRLLDLAVQSSEERRTLPVTFD